MKNIITPRNLIYAALLLAFTSCGKLQGTVAPSPNHPVFDNSFQPVTKGTYWKYVYTKDGVTDTATVTMTGLTNTYGAEFYYEAAISYKLHNFPDTTKYFANDAHMCKILSIAAPDTLNLYFFNDTTSLNNTWAAKVNNSGIIYGKQARLAGGIVEQNINLTVEGKIYTGVSHSKIYLQYSVDGNSYNTVKTYDYFIVKGVGPIEIFTSTNTGSTSSEALISYSIK